MAKIIFLCSSPRKNSNTTTLAEWVAQAARQNGHTCDLVNVAHLKYKALGCTACMACQQSDKYECVIKDEAQPLLAKIPNYDVIVFSSPIYFAALNAQMRVFMDRMFCLCKIDGETGDYTHVLHNKTFALIASAGGDMQNSGLPLVEQHLKLIAEFYNAKYASFLLPSAPFDAQQLSGNKELQQKAKKFAQEIA